MRIIQKEPSSFRDKSGFIFYFQDEVYRAINKVYANNYKMLMNSGLYDQLTKEEILVSHQEVEVGFDLAEEPYCVIKPGKIDDISYPYEWCFSQLKDAAVCTLKIQLTALKFDMSLKDASAFNIQFHKGKPIFIDTLSFEKYNEGQAWLAYRQYCQHFLVPLLLMKYISSDLNQLQKIYIDGIPLQLASKLLPYKTKFNFSILSHIHLHALSQRKHENTGTKVNIAKLPKNKLVMLISSLLQFVESLEATKTQSQWGDYYNNTNYSHQSLKEKEIIVRDFGTLVKPRKVLDLGANDGTFSRIFSEQHIPTISLDSDTQAVESNYLRMKKNNDFYLLPLISDITNPSPGIGWQNLERRLLVDRIKTDLTLALALIHHLVIGHNLSFSQIASLFADLSPHVIIEFVPKSDSQVAKMLLNRPDVFDDYNEKNFEYAFETYFDLLKKTHVKGTERSIYLYKIKNI
ncbi:MAG: hypothetical protein PHT69_16415 [Bacteroidales bacterium]|nr:hypothetical protein [Bacteroidales bacterium]